MIRIRTHEIMMTRPAFQQLNRRYRIALIIFKAGKNFPILFHQKRGSLFANRDGNSLLTLASSSLQITLRRLQFNLWQNRFFSSSSSSLHLISVAWKCEYRHIEREINILHSYPSRSRFFNPFRSIFAQLFLSNR